MAMRGLAKPTLHLGAFFGLCHLFHVYNRQEQNKVLKFFPYPMNITTAQFAVGTVVALVMWITGILQRPRVSAAQLAAILPMAMVHTMVNLFINMSPGIGKVAVSFTHVTNKAPPMEPYYYYLYFLMRKFGLYYYLLLSSVIFLGQLLAAWFVVSHAPTVTLQSSDNVPSKKLMMKTQEPLDSVNLLSIITVMSFALLAPITFLMEGVKLAPRAIRSAGLNLEPMYSTFLFSAIRFHAYQQALYVILTRIVTTHNKET